MSSLFDDTHIDQVSAPGQAWFGRIATTPDDMADKVMVTLPGFDPLLQFGPCRWQSRDATSKPERGDPCLVLQDDRDDHWVIAWWPKEFE